MTKPNPIYQKFYDRFPDSYREVDIDDSCLKTNIKRCDLKQCLSMCCYDGVYLDEDVKEPLEKLAENRRDDLTRLGAYLDGPITVEGEWRGEKLGIKTAVRDFDFKSRVKDFPEHFNQTICIFNDGKGHCTLQALAMQDNRHPWDYKPPGCWMHPLHLDQQGLNLYNEQNDIYNFPDYPGYASKTHCGRIQKDGFTADKVLKEELIYLKNILKNGYVQKQVE